VIDRNTRVVFDTNIIVSSALSRLGAPARIVDAWEIGRFGLVLSPALLAEYERALNYEGVQRRHRKSRLAVPELVDTFRRGADLVEPEDVPHVIAADPKDGMVLACAKAGATDFIVSGDPHVLDLGECQGIRIVTPAAFSALLDAEPPHA
jgi:uncharacterized protein